MHKGCIIILPKFFMVKKLRGRECHKYPSQNCCLIVTKNFVGEHICVSDNFLYGKNMKNRYLSGFCVQVFQSHDSAEKNNGYDGGGRECHNFLSENFCVTVLKDFVGKPSVLQRISASKNKLVHKGGITILAKKFMDEMGSGRECHNFPSKNCRLTVPENFVGEPFCVSEKSWYRKSFCFA